MQKTESQETGDCRGSGKLNEARPSAGTSLARSRLRLKNCRVARHYRSNNMQLFGSVEKTHHTLFLFDRKLHNLIGMAITENWSIMRRRTGGNF
jgi:hypothetical protein